MANDELVNLLYYNDADPLAHTALTEAEKRAKIFNKLIKIVPKVGTKETTQSCIAIRVVRGSKIGSNHEFKDIQIAIEVFVPWDQWLFKSTNLRPFAIIGEIQTTLNGKKIDGLGKIMGGDFDLEFLTDEISAYEVAYDIVNYD